MINLSLAQCAKTNLSNVPITDGQIVFCTDTGEFYRDVGSTRIPMALIVDSVSSLPLAPITNKFYFVSPYLYMFNAKTGFKLMNPVLFLLHQKKIFVRVIQTSCTLIQRIIKRIGLMERVMLP